MQRLNCGLVELRFTSDDQGTETMTFSGYGAAFGNVHIRHGIDQPIK